MTDTTRPTYEEFDVDGADVIRRIKEIAHDSTVSRIYIKSEDGETILELPLAAGVAIAAAGTLIAPALVAIGGVAALLTRVIIGVARRAPSPAGK
jgi:hypothetical protein